MLSAAQWAEAKKIFEAVSEMDPGKRAATLSELCKNDDLLRHEVESLLEYHGRAESFIEQPVAASFAADSGTPEPAGGRRVGAYVLVREIGRGGMGRVYLAHRADEEFDKVVAVKLVKRGMDTDLVLHRFRGERQILARLEHPNIARLLDAGTTDDGLPFVVMEYVEGHPIDRYCDLHQLSITNRLKLFQSVCSAVQYAHQHLVVHRDLKPPNIIVSNEGVPKLLDFGIAKLLSSDTPRATATGLRIMTPEWASPEQIRGEPVTTASDIYSLGLLLYLLLTGHRSRQTPAPAVAAKASTLTFREPMRPSEVISKEEERAAERGVERVTAQTVSAPREGTYDKLKRRLSGDLDNIVLKALRDDAGRRYASVEQFSEDIQRHLDGLPVIARPDTLVYRTAKFLRRNRVATIAAALVLVSLIAGLAATLRQASIARTERARAERRFNEVRKLADSFMFEIHDSIERLPGSLAARQLLVRRAVEYLDSLASEAGNDHDLQDELATAYSRIATLTFEVPRALESHRKAARIEEQLVAEDPANPKYRENLSSIYLEFGGALQLSGDLRAALQYSSNGLAEIERLGSDTSGDAVRGEKLYEALIQNGLMRLEAGDLRGARQSQERALAVLDTLSKKDPRNKEYQREPFICHGYLARGFALDGDYEQASQHCRRALAICERLSAEDPVNATYRRDVAVALRIAGPILSKLGRDSEAASGFQKSIGIMRGLESADPEDVGHHRTLAITYLALAQTLEEKGRVADALRNYQLARDISTKLAAADAERIESKVDLAESRAGIGRLLLRSGKLPESLTNLQQAQAALESLAEQNPSAISDKIDLADIYQSLGDWCAMNANRQSARRELRDQNLRDASSWYQRSLSGWVMLQSAGTLPGAYRDRPDSLLRLIGRTNAAAGE